MSKHVQEYTVQRITYRSELPVTEVRARLHAAVNASVPDGKALADLLAASTKEEFERRAKSLKGEGGDFMLFNRIPFSNWMRFFLDNPVVPLVETYTIGNPLIAQTMLSKSWLTGLYVPPRLIIWEKDVGGQKGTEVVYDLPSSMIAAGDEGELRKAAEVLDQKLERLVKSITGA